ncbi:DUF1223 domain-containing protein [Marinomonas agarivorans]|nr:DUF1223 domain-containing protein [Marinomonas agarivorans]
MQQYLSFLFVTLIVFIPQTVSGQTFQTGTTAPTVIELYTSEGCSSCPPADRFLADFAKQEDPFQSVIPLAYHVDYWNYIGWDDRFSRPEYSSRQRQHVREGHTSQVYTPGFVVNNKEWRAWFRGNRQVPQNQGAAGQLSAELKNGILQAQYTGHPSVKGPYLLHVAYLGMGITTQVKAGENRGRTLNHDYVVLNTLSQISQTNQWQLKLDSPPEQGQKQTAIALWVSPAHELDVLQADAALLEAGAF